MVIDCCYPCLELCLLKNNEIPLEKSLIFKTTTPHAAARAFASDLASARDCPQGLSLALLSYAPGVCSTYIYIYSFEHVFASYALGYAPRVFVCQTTWQCLPPIKFRAPNIWHGALRFPKDFAIFIKTLGFLRFP